MTTPQQQSIAGFFSGGGGASVSWKDKPLGTIVQGTVKMVHPPSPQTDPATKEPVINKKTGQPKMQIRIDLQTTERDPADPDDDGVRGLYVSGWMIGALGDALRKAGVDEPQVGGQLAVQLTERVASDTPGLNPYNKYVAQYVAAPVTNGFFAAPPAASPAPAPTFTPLAQPPVAPPQQPAAAPQTLLPAFPPLIPQGTPQPLISGQGYAPAPAPQPIAQQAVVEPPKPDAISQAAWDTMDLATKTNLAATIGAANLPPF